MSLTDALILLAVGMVSGIVNTIAGGGSLLSFPALLAIGFDPLTANVTNTVGLTPGYFGGTLAYRRELAPQRRRAIILCGSVALGSIAGCAILLLTPEEVFESVVPFLVLGAVALLAVQPRLRDWLKARRGVEDGSPQWGALHATAFAGGLYGAYFGAALGVMLLALLGLFLHEGLQRANGLKTLFSFVSAIVAVAVFAAFSGRVEWAAAGCLAASSLFGGQLGGVLARRLSERVLRICVLVVGLGVGLRLLFD